METSMTYPLGIGSLTIAALLIIFWVDDLSGQRFSRPRKATHPALHYNPRLFPGLLRTLSVIVGCLGGTVVGMFLFGPWAGVIGGAAGLIGIPMVLERRARNRVNAVVDERLGEAVEMIQQRIGSGVTLQQALNYAWRTMDAGIDPVPTATIGEDVIAVQQRQDAVLQKNPVRYALWWIDTRASRTVNDQLVTIAGAATALETQTSHSLLAGLCSYLTMAAADMPLSDINRLMAQFQSELMQHQRLADTRRTAGQNAKVASYIGPILVGLLMGGMWFFQTDLFVRRWFAPTGRTIFGLMLLFIALIIWIMNKMMNQREPVL